jgi:hypothetical protein
VAVSRWRLRRGYSALYCGCGGAGVAMHLLLHAGSLPFRACGLMVTSNINMLSALLHTADIGHSCLPWKLHMKHSLQVAQEFYTQFNAEKERGLPTLPFMGKEPVISEISGVQGGFLNFVVTPLIVALDHFSSGRMGFVKSNLQRNKERWDKLAKGETLTDEDVFDEPRDVGDLAKTRASVCARYRSQSTDMLEEGSEEGSNAG